MLLHSISKDGLPSFRSMLKSILHIDFCFSTAMYGFILIIFAYLIWGFFPLYFKQMAVVPSLDILMFRTFFTLVWVLPIALMAGKRKEMIRQLKSLRNLGMLFINALLISVNWLLFIILVNTGHTLQASLGYYINPLLTILFALIFFGERFGKLQWTSIALATVGVTIFAFGVGTLPWGALSVATTFGLYGVMKKICPTDSLTSLTLETALLTPFVIVYFFYNHSFEKIWEIDPWMFSWLFGCGGITALTLLLYGSGAIRVKLSTLGLCQYITPTGQFITAVLVFKEPMLNAQWYCFFFIWTALFLFTLDSLRSNKSKNTYKKKGISVNS